MSIVLLAFGILGGLVSAAAVWLSGAGLWFALLGYIVGGAAVGIIMALWIIARVALSPAPPRLPTQTAPY